MRRAVADRAGRLPLSGGAKVGLALIAVEVGALLWMGLQWRHTFQALYAEFAVQVPAATRFVFGPAWLPAVLGSLAALLAAAVRSEPRRRDTLIAVTVFVGLVSIGVSLAALYGPLFQLGGNIKTK